MRWFFSAHKATRCFLKSQQYHHHPHRSSSLGSSYSRSFDTSIGWPKPSWRKRPSLSWFSGHRYSSTSTILDGTESSYRSMNCAKREEVNTKVDLEIISRETVKPYSPTPHHLKTVNLSIIDQYFFDCYTPLILFLPNNDKASITDVITKRSKRLKESLSDVLARFYPFAGEVKDNNLQIECSDKGSYFVEARVNQTLKDFLGNPDDQKIRQLNPETPHTGESAIRNYIIGVQVNIFNCGAIGLSTTVSHKIFDGHTYFLFIKAWAAAARGSLETINSPSFVASKVFPNNPSLKYSLPSKLMTTELLSTKRFVFGSTSLASLKAQTVTGSSASHGSPTRVEATTSLLWKAVAKAASTVRPFSPQSPHALFSLVNLRKRSSPCLPDEAIGNIVGAATGICFPERQPDMTTLIGEIRGSIAKVNSDYVEALKGENGHKAFDEILRMINVLADATEVGDCLFATSVLNSGIYEMDFGWGKPIWWYDMNAGFPRIMVLNDTPTGDGGVEATVTLSPSEMELFERDPEVLSYATVNPSPLLFLQD